MNNQDGTNTDMSSPAGNPTLNAPPARGLTRGTWIGLIVVVLVLAVVVVLGIASRSHQQSVLLNRELDQKVQELRALIETQAELTHEMADAAKYVRLMLPPPFTGEETLDIPFGPEDPRLTELPR